MLSRDPGDTERRGRSQDLTACGPADAAAALAERVDRIVASASGVEGSVRVTVGSSGAVASLELDDRVRRLTGAELAAEIVRVMRRAQAGLTDRVVEAVQATIGADTRTGRAVIESFAERFPLPLDAPSNSPVMPSPPPFPSFGPWPSLPHQVVGGSSAAMPVSPGAVTESPGATADSSEATSDSSEAMARSQTAGTRSRQEVPG